MPQPPPPVPIENERVRRRRKLREYMREEAPGLEVEKGVDQVSCEYPVVDRREGKLTLRSLAIT
jgi:hypothetical protein